MSATKVLIAPLDWGLGHATRSAALINKYLAKGWDVRLASAGNARLWLQSEFPEIFVEELPVYDIRYSAKYPMSWMMLKQFPKLKAVIKAEHEWLLDWAEREKPDLIISDNRYGMYHPEVESAIVCHQLFIQAGAFSKQVNAINHKWLKQFNAVWIPDFEGTQNLAGALSHGKHDLNVKYIGPLSRFEKGEAQEIKYQYLGLISGPEPHRTELEKTLRTLFAAKDENCLIVQGLPGKPKRETIGNLEIVNHLPTHELRNAILSSEKIICRPGYSTIMDLHVLGKTATFIPTPGQSEQAYLVEYHENLNGIAMLAR